MAKVIREKILTPPGTVKFAHIGKPNILFNPDGVYSVDLILDPAEPSVQALVARCSEMAAKAKTDFLAAETDPKKKKALASFAEHGPFTQDLDKEGNETGMIVFRAKQSAMVRVKGKDPFAKTVSVFDTKRSPMTNKNVGRGSVIRVAGLANPFVMPSNRLVGITVWLEAVQVIEMQEFGGQGAESYGFGDEEGYTGGGVAPGPESLDPQAESLDPQAAEEGGDF